MIYCKELAHATVEADKPPDLWEEAESQEPRTAKTVVPAWVWRCENQNWSCRSVSERPAGMRPRKNRCFHSSPKARKPSVPVQKNSLFLEGGSDILFRSGLQLIGWGPPVWEICFTQYIPICVNLIQKHPYRSTQNTVCMSWHTGHRWVGAQT